MVGMVIVSHSQKLAEGVVEEVVMMARGIPIEAAGGLDDGMLGTSYDKIMKAITSVNQGDGVVLLMDMGSAVMTAEMVADDMSDVETKLVDCPLVEGAISAGMAILTGSKLEDVVKSAREALLINKL